jgi:hypothetical protein
MNHNVEYKNRLNHIEYNYYNYCYSNYLAVTVTTIKCGIGHVCNFLHSLHYTCMDQPTQPSALCAHLQLSLISGSLAHFDFSISHILLIILNIASTIVTNLIH